MNTIRGVLYDGLTARATPVDVTRDGDSLLVNVEGNETSLALGEARLDAPVVGGARTLTLPDGRQIVSDDLDAIVQWFPSVGWIDRWAFRLESQWAISIAAVALIVGSAWLFIQVLLPLAAEPVARMLHPRAEQLLSVQALSTLDRTVLKPSQLPEERQKQIRERFHAFVAGEPDASALDLKFRSGAALGPNALALPGGVIVVTDDMVKLSTDDQLLAVLAHEIGHVRGKHALRMILQSSGVVVLMTAVAGDAMSMTVLAAAVPTMLLQSHYSREFELEADDYAFAHLKRHGYSPQLFADVMRRMEKAEKAAGTDGVFRYFSSHPATDERIQRAEAQR